MRVMHLERRRTVGHAQVLDGGGGGAQSQDALRHSVTVQLARLALALGCQDRLHLTSSLRGCLATFEGRVPFVRVSTETLMATHYHMIVFTEIKHSIWGRISEANPTCVQKSSNAGFQP